MIINRKGSRLATARQLLSKIKIHWRQAKMGYYLAFNLGQRTF
jgi:hypothetical protein